MEANTMNHDQGAVGSLIWIHLSNKILKQIEN